jgi:transketolase
VDHNRLPQYSWPNAGGEGLTLHQPEIRARWEAFGWHVDEVDGHDMEQVVQTLRQARQRSEGIPKAIVAHTVKGKGVSFMEHQFGWHARPMTEDHYRTALSEFENGL